MPANLAAIPPSLDTRVARALAARGITELYAHQAEAFELARAGRDLVISTPTASGKSLCYNLPVLDALARDPGARALYLFPTKALSRDQEEALRASLAAAEIDCGAITYDGDTPGDARRAARQGAGVLLTNPDMLHAGILPHHAAWARVLSSLRYVVIDELHTYRGVFGSHLANVLRRLLRIARFHGSDPTFIFASATIGNPAEHAGRMLGREVALVDQSGAPQNPRTVLVYNPPVVNAELGIRRSYIKTAVDLAGDLVGAGVPTLVFGQSRNNVEVMLKYLRDRLAPQGIPPERIVAYRGGYLPGTRRRLEAELRAGEISCVVATNALELGIDIGSLDAVVCAGYPGSVAALWQRFGRGGRRGKRSLAVLVASSAPLDQYFANRPDQLLSAPIEQARIDPDNVEILVQHLKCAAFELPVRDGETLGDLPAESVREAMGFLGQHGIVHPTKNDDGATVFHWSTAAYPANHVSLRSVGWDNVVVIDVSCDTNIAEMDWRSSHTMLHEQAIYQHEGRQYQVERLDHENHKAFVRPVRSDYFTTAMTHTAVSVIDSAARDRLDSSGGLWAESGEVSVVQKVVGFKKIKFYTHENTGYGEVHLPEMEMHTTAVWLTFGNRVIVAQGVPRPQALDALRGLANALHTVAAVGLMIDPRDLGCTVEEQDSPGAGYDPSVYLFDRIPGGVGLAPRIYADRRTVLERAAQLMRSCGCDDGCPGCIGPQAGVANVDRKRIAIGLLRDVGVR